MMPIFLISALLSLFAQANAQVAHQYRISGVVVDSVTNVPVPRAQVSISLGNDAATATAGDDGRFVLAGLQAGKYTLSAAAPGYVREAYNQHGAFSIGIAVGDGQDSEHLIFRLDPQAIIYGRVMDDRGEPVRSAQVQLFASERVGGRRAKFVHSQMQTNDLGEYRFAHLLPGKYYVVVEARPWYAETQLFMQTRQNSGFGGNRRRSVFVSGAGADSDPVLDVVYPTTFYPGVTDERSSEELTLGAGDQMQANITLQAVPAAHLLLTGLPQGEGNTLSVGTAQKIFGTFSSSMGTAFGQISPGEYEVAGLPPGKVTLVVNTNRGNEWTSRTIEADTSLGGTIDASALQTAAKVSGQVFLRAGTTEVGPGQIILVNATAGAPPGANATIQGDGTFHFPEVQPGTYRIQVNLRSGGYFVQRISAENANVSGREVTIGAASEVNLTVSMGQGLSQVTGIVHQNDKPKAGVMVLLLPESGLEIEEDSRMDESDSDGTFRLAGILPGDYTLLAINDGWDLDWAKPGALKAYLPAGQRLTIGPNQSMKVTAQAQDNAATRHKEQ